MMMMTITYSTTSFIHFTYGCFITFYIYIALFVHVLEFTLLSHEKRMKKVNEFAHIFCNFSPYSPFSSQKVLCVSIVSYFHRHKRLFVTSSVWLYVYLRVFSAHTHFPQWEFRFYLKLNIMWTNWSSWWSRFRKHLHEPR